MFSSFLFPPGKPAHVVSSIRDDDGLFGCASRRKNKQHTHAHTHNNVQRKKKEEHLVDPRAGSAASFVHSCFDSKIGYS